MVDIQDEVLTHWEYQVLVDDEWVSPHAANQDPHRYETKEALLHILNIIHPGERVRILKVDELQI